MRRLFGRRKKTEIDTAALEKVTQVFDVAMNIELLKKTMSRYNIGVEGDPDLDRDLVNFVEFVTLRCLKEAGFASEHLSESQTIFAMMIAINIADPVTQFIRMQSQFEMITSAVCMNIFLPHWMKNAGSLFSEASTNYNRMSGDKEQSVIIRTVGNATWAFLKNSNADELEPVKETFRMLLPSVGVR